MSAVYLLIILMCERWEGDASAGECRCRYAFREMALYKFITLWTDQLNTHTHTHTPAPSDMKRCKWRWIIFISSLRCNLQGRVNIQAGDARALIAEGVGRDKTISIHHTTLHLDSKQPPWSRITRRIPYFRKAEGKDSGKIHVLAASQHRVSIFFWRRLVGVMINPGREGSLCDLLLARPADGRSSTLTVWADTSRNTYMCIRPQVGLEAIQNTRCDPKGRFHDCMRGFIVHCDIFSFWFHPLLLTIEPNLPQLPSLGLWYHTSSSSTFLLSSRQNCDIAPHSDVCSV